jgi:imidazolonepropionase-like amidohydrolase
MRTLVALSLLALALGCQSGAGAGARRAAVTASTDTAVATYAGRPLAESEEGYAIRARKVLTMDGEHRVFDPGMLIVRDRKIEYVGAPVEVPSGFAELDFSEGWVAPGFVEIHSHVQSGTWGDINDMVMPVNPELSVAPAVRPSNPWVRRACAGGCTTIFGIPGSGTSISGFGVLFKAKTDATYDEIVVRDPGGLKTAFNYNPQRSSGDLGASWCGLSYTVERLNERTLSAIRRGDDNPALEDLKRVHQGELPVICHCASAEGVAGTVRLWKKRFDTEVIVSHGSWDGHMAAAFAAQHGVPVNHGPRTMNFTTRRREDRIVGGAKSYMDAGVSDFSLNTDAQVLPQEELFLQGAMSARLGADSYQMLRAVTTNPARSFLIDHRVGSLEVGKDADIVISSGDPLDPRSRVELVLIDGEIQYSRLEDGQWF